MSPLCKLQGGGQPVVHGSLRDLLGSVEAMGVASGPHIDQVCRLLRRLHAGAAPTEA